MFILGFVNDTSPKNDLHDAQRRKL
jgi:hypothetical protein